MFDIIGFYSEKQTSNCAYDVLWLIKKIMPNVILRCIPLMEVYSFYLGGEIVILTMEK